MADGSSQTIDRLQVEISLNSADLNSELQSVNSQIDSTKTKLGSLESSTGSASKSMGSFGSSVSASKAEFDSYNKSLQTADKTYSVYTKYTKTAATDTESMCKAAYDASMCIDVFGDELGEAGKDIDWIPEAASNMGNMASNTSSLADKAMSAKKMVGALKGGLAGLGITAGINAIINKFAEMATAAREANDAYNDIKKNLISYTGELNTEQLQMVDSIYVNSVDSTGFTDRDQVTKAVGSVVTLWSDATADAQKEIATKLSTLQAVGRISDTGSFAETSKGTFAEWGIGSGEAASSMEYLYYVSQQTGVGMEELTSFMGENAETLQKLGYTFSESANLIGSSWNSVGGMKDMDSLMSDFDTNYDTKLDELTSSWQESHEDMAMDDATLKKLEEEAEEWAIAQARAYGNKLPSALKEAQADAVSSDKAWENIVKTDTETSETIRKNKEEFNTATNPQILIEMQEGTYANELEQIRKRLSDYGDEGIFGINVASWAHSLASSNLEGEGYTIEEALAAIDREHGVEPIEVPVTPVVTEGESVTTTAETTSIVDTSATEEAVSNLEDLGDATKEVADNVSDLEDAVDKTPKAIEEMGNASAASTEQVKTFNDEGAAPLAESTVATAAAMDTINAATVTYTESLPGLIANYQSEKTAVDNLAASYRELAAAKLASVEA